MLGLLVLALSLVLMISAILATTPYLKTFLLSTFIVISGYALTVNSQVYEYVGECISFRKYSLFKNDDVMPYIEIPAINISDYTIRRVLHAYYLVIIIDDESSKPKKINIPLHWFKEFQIISIVKSLENIKRSTIIDHKKEIEKLLRGNL